MSICVVFNPAARGSKARKLRASLEQIGAQARLKATACAGDARRLAAEAVLEGCTTVVAAGGDGTLNEVLNGLADVEGGFRNTRLGILPMGTVNVFARELGIPLELKPAWELILRGREQQIDLGHAQYGPENEKRFFLQMAGAGFDARTVENTSTDLKKKIGPGAYLVAGLQTLSKARPKITASNGTEKASGDMIIIGNGKFYGGPFPLFHKADYLDGLLDVVILPNVTWPALPGHTWNFLTGRMFKDGSTIYLRGSEITLECSEPAAFQLEGELVGKLPATIRVQPRSLRVIIP